MTIERERIVLAGLWTALMLTFLLGDVLRLFAGDFVAGEMDGQPMGQGAWLGAAMIMVIPILMLPGTLMLPHRALRRVTIVLSALWVVFNAFGLPYVGWYDNFLIGVSVLLNVMAIRIAWRWRPPVA